MTGYITSTWTAFLDDADDVLEWLDDEGDYMITETDETGEIIEHSLERGRPSRIRQSVPLYHPDAVRMLDECEPDRARRMLGHKWASAFPPAFKRKLEDLVAAADEEDAEQSYVEEQEAYAFRRWQEEEYGKGI